MEIRFKGRIREAGPTNYVVTVPKVYLDNNLVNTDTEYDFIIEQKNE